MKEKKSRKRMVSLLLAAVMFVTAWGGSVRTAAAEVKTDAVDATGVEGRRNPKNPVYDAETDTTEWSYVWFGRYPQTEVTGDALTSAITGASYDSKGDATVNGVQYRRLSRDSVTNTNYFGDSAYRYFKWEPIKWRVLQNDGETLFLLADQGLDCQQYHHTSTAGVKWLTSSLRDWLNGTFYNAAFYEERQAIRQQTIMNEEGNTQDHVYLLSEAEAKDPKYGFSEDYLKDSNSRQMNISDYANVMGAYRNSGEYDNDAKYEGNGAWWLRSLHGSGYAAIIPEIGSVNRIRAVNEKDGACVPALHIDLSSDLWKSADGNPVYDAETDTTEWSYVWFGRYPQTEVTGDALTEAIRSASYDGGGDAVVNGEKYRRLSKSSVEDADNFGSNEYRYFKWEPIRWRVLQNDGETLFLLADQGLDYQQYHTSYTAVTWSACTLRGWLNDTFYTTAFRSGERSAVRRQTVVNADHPEYGTSGGSDTQDNVYLLSIEEVENPDYGFPGEQEIQSKSRQMKMSDYASVLGADRNASGEYVGNGSWWLRSPATERTVSYIHYTGARQNLGNPVHYKAACVPALHIDLSADFWMSEEEMVEAYEEARWELEAAFDVANEKYDEVDVYTEDSWREFGQVYAEAERIMQQDMLYEMTLNELREWTKELLAAIDKLTLKEPSDTSRNPANPVYDAETDTAEWSRVWFGSYPQTEVTEEAQISKLEQISFDSNGDAWADGTKYRRIRRGDVSNTGNFGDREYRYFKWERIPWRVLRNDGDMLYLLADQGLDCQDYSTNSGNYGEASWKNSALRGWLNDDFYSAAFDGKEQAAILERSDLLKGDKLGLLTEEEARDTDRGFGSADSSDTRIMGASAYAYRMGSGQQSGKFLWWLMPNRLYTYTYATVAGGIRLADVMTTMDAWCACVPTLCIRRDSALWLSEDDGTSGSGGGDDDGTGGGEEENKPLEVSDPHIEIIKGDEGVEVKFSLVVRGASQKYEYQWYESETMNGTGRRMEDGAYKEDVSVEGANQSVLTMRMPELSEAYCQGYYYCVVTDGAEMVESGRVDLSDNVEEKPDNPVTPEAPSENEIKNPVYNAATDSTTWSAVWFGSYPQSEVTGAVCDPAVCGAG